MSTNEIQGITEQDLANYLASNPSFFERYAELLAAIQLSHPLGHRTVSLQERQADMLRQRIKGLEQRIIEMIRAGTENLGHFEKLQRWTLAQMQDGATPEGLLDGLREQFLIPQAALRVWGVKPEHAEADWAAPVADEVKALAAEMSEPRCTLNDGSAPSRWVAGPVGSMALIPLRRPGQGPDAAPFGLIVLSSPDATRYAPDKGNEFLLRVAEVAGTALAKHLA
ncbi:DUF484 family protein [Inhella crocodyli]|uniref:DUF484 family protein n=1 Tax=Inhella crocodyli TaxID=2499851 RepID=UPI001F0B9F97|nr:DUF484 family protein [Inhella crocodyli]